MDNEAEQAPETVDATDTKRRRGNYKGPRERATAVALLVEAGMEPKDAARQLGYKVKNNSQALERLNRYGIQELITKRRVKSALHGTDSFLPGRGVGEVTPNPSVTWQAAAAVLDRAYPRQVEGSAAPVSFTVVNLSLVAPGNMQSNAETVDITPVLESDRQ